MWVHRIFVGQQTMPKNNSPTGCPISERATAFTPFKGEYQNDPAGSLRWAREQEPVFYSPEIGYWVVTRYEDVKSVFRDPILFSPSVALEKVTPAPPEAQEILKKYGYNLQRTMVNEDEPQHMERRRLLLDAFLPENLKKHESSIQKLSRQYMDRFIDKGRADLVGEMFSEIPLTVALHFLGVPDEGADQLRQFSVAHTLNTWGRPTREEQLEISENVGRFWKTSNHILDRMRSDPTGDGWMFDTIRAHMEHPEVVPESYLRSMMMAILVAAHETTSKATANMFWTLLSDRAAWEELCENPSLIPSAVEECLRFAGSIVAWRRIATDDTEVGGVKIPSGGKLMIVQASANRDERYWENPDDVDIYRDNAADHLTFGYGAHQCMGKNIARMEMRIFVEEFVRRLPHIRLIKGQEFRNLPNMSLRGPESLLVEWDPARNPERMNPKANEHGMCFTIGAPVKDNILRQVVVADIVREAEGTIRAVLADRHGRNLPRWTPGSHIDLVSGDIRRKYSLCGDCEDTRTWQVAILREDYGRGGSVHFHDTLRRGQALHVAGPKNHFKLDESAASYVLIAGGIGITPMIAMADRLKRQERRYMFHYCGASRKRMALLDRVIADHGEALSLHISDEGSRIDLAVTLAELRAGDQLYSCGPERMLEALDEMSGNWPEGTLHVEHFTTRSTILDPEEEHAFSVDLVDSGFTIEVRRDQTLLNALLSAGLDVPNDCNEGLCGTCEVAVLGGDIDHRDRVLTNSERDTKSRMMACCSRAIADRLRLAL